MRLIKQLRARPRTYLAIALGAVIAWLLPATYAWSTRLLLAWDVAVLFWILAVAVLMATSDTHAMRRRAAAQDEGAVLILLASSLSAVASLVAIAIELSAIKQGVAQQGFRSALAAATVLFSWVFVHLSFTLHYAHEYYGDGESRNGLVFPGPRRDADYWDFAYFAINIGAAGQTSDIQIATPALRRIVLAHTALSFFFNTTVIALGVNVAASAL